jgi:hypothetical protein
MHHQYDNPTDAAEVPGGLLPTRYAAARLGLSPRTLERWRVLGTGPVFRRLGRAVRYALVDLEAFAAARVRVSTRDRSDR